MHFLLPTHKSVDVAMKHCTSLTIYCSTSFLAFPINCPTVSLLLQESSPIDILFIYIHLVIVI